VGSEDFRSGVDRGSGPGRRAKPGKHRVSNARGLYLNVGRNGGAPCLFRYNAGKNVKGNPIHRKMGLSARTDVTIDDDRKKARPLGLSTTRAAMRRRRDSRPRGRQGAAGVKCEADHVPPDRGRLARRMGGGRSSAAGPAPLQASSASAPSTPSSICSARPRAHTCARKQPPPRAVMEV
jgi:hypothetical protein